MLTRFGSNLPWPDIMIVDLNLPRRNGFDVLRERRGSHTLTRIPAVVLTSSRREVDVDAAYDSGANAFMQKPVTLDGMIGLAGLVHSYWLNVVVRSSPPAAIRAES